MFKINKVRANHVVDFAAEELKKYLRMMMPESGDIDIVVYKGSYAEEYGIENELDRLVIIDSYIGDANRDGWVSVSDVTVIQRFLISITGEPEPDLGAADVDGDGEITVNDATYIQRFLAKFADPCHIDRTSASW